MKAVVVTMPIVKRKGQNARNAVLLASPDLGGGETERQTPAFTEVSSKPFSVIISSSATVPPGRCPRMERNPRSADGQSRPVAANQE
jgi:hypothetical protein